MNRFTPWVMPPPPMGPGTLFQAGVRDGLTALEGSGNTILANSEKLPSDMAERDSWGALQDRVAKSKNI